MRGREKGTSAALRNSRARFLERGSVVSSVTSAIQTTLSSISSKDECECSSVWTSGRRMRGDVVGLRGSSWDSGTRVDGKCTNKYFQNVCWWTRPLS